MRKESMPWNILELISRGSKNPMERRWYLKHSKLGIWICKRTFPMLQLKMNSKENLSQIGLAHTLSWKCMEEVHIGCLHWMGRSLRTPLILGT